MRMSEVMMKPKDEILRMRGCKVGATKQVARRGKENIDSVLNTSDISTMLDDIEVDELGWERTDANLPARPRTSRR